MSGGVGVCVCVMEIFVWFGALCLCTGGRVFNCVYVPCVSVCVIVCVCVIVRVPDGRMHDARVREFL